MRISEIEIYSSKQILAFIEYLKVLADEKKAIEDMQSHYALGAVGNANYLNQATALRVRHLNGDFDASEEESDDWAASPDGQAAYSQLVGTIRSN